MKAHRRLMQALASFELERKNAKRRELLKEHPLSAFPDYVPPAGTYRPAVEPNPGARALA